MARYHSPNNQINWPFGSGVQNRFQDSDHGGYLGFLIGTILVFYTCKTPMLPTKFSVNWSLGSGEEAKNRFSR